MAMRCGLIGRGWWARAAGAVAAWVMAMGAGGVGVGLCLAGPLNPPLGPITSTGRTLSEVQPRTPIGDATTPGDGANVHVISQPGSYYLVGNVAGASGKNGIRITVSNVTLDLNGFAVTGVAGSNLGIVASTVVTGVQVRNGTVSNWGSVGLELANAESTLVEGVIAVGNGATGIRNGRQGVSRFCTARGNGNNGIQAFDGGVVEGCAAFDNGGAGIFTSTACVVRGCVARQNTGNGIDSGVATLVVECAAYSNDGAGISLTGTSTVERCVARLNGADGISIGNASVARWNTCGNNGAASVAAGILVTGSDCRIEGNTCTGNDIGIDVNAAGNVIVRNTCSGNATNNWDIVAGNVCLVVNAATAGAITGNAGGVAPGSTDPSANFTY